MNFTPNASDEEEGFNSKPIKMKSPFYGDANFIAHMRMKFKNIEISILEFVEKKNVYTVANVFSFLLTIVYFF